jgi:cellulose synthase/poly-beta-1,6-N-acetylglucosamine synthase-like glycosyltransferase
MSLLESIPNIITIVFFIVVLSYYVLLFIKKKKPKLVRKFNSISVIIPAHNEERYIAQCIKSVIKARFHGEKEIIVVDDGSKDKTSEIALKFPEVKLIKTPHTGKSASINQAISVSKGELIAIVDGDSVISEDALIYTTKEVERKNVAAASCVIKVKNRKRFICMWFDLEQLYNSLIRQIFSKLNANIVTPGPLGVYRKKELLGVGGFSVKGFSEDIDITIRLIRKGYKIGFSSKAIAETNMPYKPKGVLRQRTRFARGIIDIFKKHLKINTAIIDIYTLPLFLFNYVQAVIMGSFTIYQVVDGYTKYFLAKGIYFSPLVLKFFFEWFSILGFFKWTISVLAGQTPLTLIAVVGIISTLLTYPLYIYAILKYSKKFDFIHIFALFFMAPFWLLIMFIYIISLPEYFKKDQHNIWKKNE